MAQGALFSPIVSRARPGAAALLWRMIRRRRITGVGAALILIVVLGALAAPLLAPYDPVALNVPDRLQGPRDAHPFGTDEFGRDILSRTLYGAPLSLLVGAPVTAPGTTAGVLVGLAAGSSPRADRLLMRLMDGLLA